MTPLTALAMSQTKDELLKHLNLPPETYSRMSKETDRVYKWLTSDPSHLKQNCKRNGPYDWSDILEKSKDAAMNHIAQSGDQYTDYYWGLAAPTEDCPNWIARWFLYHKFRYRDGRNRNPTTREDTIRNRSHGNASHRRRKHSCGEYNDATTRPSLVSASGNSAFFNENGATVNYHSPYGYGDAFNPPSQPKQRVEHFSTVYYDPVRDVCRK